MSMGLRQSRHFARRKRRRRFIKWVFILALFAGLGAAGYQSGKWLSRAELRQARMEIDRLARSVGALEGENARLRAAAETARMHEAALRKRFEKEVPTGELRRLLDLVAAELEEGADVDRLRFLIAAASDGHECDGEPVSKRFMVRTPLYNGGGDVVTFAADALTLTAEGVPAEDDQGRVQAWFDPSKPITLNLARLGEEPSRVSSTLPLHHALVVNGDEYRLSVVPGERRGFVNVTADRCRFP